MKLKINNIYKYKLNKEYYFLQIKQKYLLGYLILLFNKKQKSFDTRYTSRITRHKNQYYIYIDDNFVEIMPTTDEDKLKLL